MIQGFRIMDSPSYCSPHTPLTGSLSPLTHMTHKKYVGTLLPPVHISLIVEAARYAKTKVSDTRLSLGEVLLLIWKGDEDLTPPFSNLTIVMLDRLRQCFPIGASSAEVLALLSSFNIFLLTPCMKCLLYPPKAPETIGVRGLPMSVHHDTSPE